MKYLKANGFYKKLLIIFLEFFPTFIFLDANSMKMYTTNFEFYVVICIS